MNEDIHCISNKEKRKKQQMNRKMMTKTVLKFYTMHIKNYFNSFSIRTC